MNARPALFLDIDAVLAPQGRRNPRVLDEACVGRLRRILAVTGARVVLSSSWPLREARAVLRPLGVAVACALGEDRRTYDGRPREIARWLQKHPAVRRWVVLDDDPILRSVAKLPADDSGRMLLAEPSRVLETDYFHSDWAGGTRGAGLTEEIAEAAIRALSTDAAPVRPSLNAEIARVRAAVERRERQFGEMREQARDACCPSCFHGRRYAELADRQERALSWLAVLLGKRGGTGDASMAHAIRMGAWP